MFLPIADDDRKLVKPAYVTWLLLLINFVMYLVQISRPEVTYQFSTVPAEITSGKDITEMQLLKIGNETIEIPHQAGPRPIFLTLITSVFLHVSWVHLLGNMLYLWIFGDNVEHRFGHFKFLMFYLLSGVMASLAQVAITPSSTIPMLGASGAISGILGAYLVLFPRNRVYTFFFFYLISLPAVVVIIVWVAFQLISGFLMLHAGALGGVAYGAHLGGFAAGVAGGALARSFLKEEPDTPIRRAYQRDPDIHYIW